MEFCLNHARIDQFEIHFDNAATFCTIALHTTTLLAFHTWCHHTQLWYCVQHFQCHVNHVHLLKNWKFKFATAIDFERINVLKRIDNHLEPERSGSNSAVPLAPCFTVWLSVHSLFENVLVHSLLEATLFCRHRISMQHTAHTNAIKQRIAILWNNISCPWRSIEYRCIFHHRDTNQAFKMPVCVSSTKSVRMQGSLSISSHCGAYESYDISQRGSYHVHFEWAGLTPPGTFK